MRIMQSLIMLEIHDHKGFGIEWNIAFSFLIAHSAQDSVYLISGEHLAAP